MYTRLPASRAAVVLAAIAFSACVPARSGPAPASLPVPAPIPAAGTEPELLGGALPPVEAVVAPPKRDILGTGTYDLPVEGNSWVEAELDFLVGQRSGVLRSWLERGDFYEAYIKGVLKETGVPTDLYHLAMIESGFIPTARSRAGAVGLWQFMAPTARGYGLRMDSLVDERMDPVRSTRAAARHLRGLHRSLGDWPLATAAYNAGSGRISRGLKAFAVSSYWDLAQRGDLAEETKRYVPRLYAMTVVGHDRARFGFAPPAGADRFAFDSIQVEYETPLGVLAELGKVPVERLKGLNPHLLADVVPGGGYWVWVPAGSSVALQRAWLASDFRKDQGYGSYTVRWGDNLGSLGELSGIRTARIRELNPKVDFDKLQTGEKLRLPFRVAQTLTARPARDSEKAPVAAVEAERSGAGVVAAADVSAAERTHIVADGETLWGIARDYDVAVETIQKANGLDGTTIRPGLALQISTPSVTRTDGVEKKAQEHVVEPGESLWSIARKYGSSVEAINQANRLDERPIQPGQKLTIPAN